MIQAGLERLGQQLEDWEDMPLSPTRHTDQQHQRWSTAAASPAKIRHFPKHLLRQPGDPPRPPVPKTGGSDPHDPWGDGFDSKASGGKVYDPWLDESDHRPPLVFPTERLEGETRSQRRVRKREAGIAKNIERDFGKGIMVLPGEDKEEEEPSILVPRYGPAPGAKKKKQGAKRKSSKPMPHYQN